MASIRDTHHGKHYVMVEGLYNNMLYVCKTDEDFDRLMGRVNDPENFDEIGWEIDRRTASWIIGRNDTFYIGVEGDLYEYEIG